MKHSALTVMFLAIGLALVGAVAVASARQAGGAGPVLTVGVITAETGKAAYIGKAEADLLRRLQAEWKRAPASKCRIRLEFSDSGSDPKRACELFRMYANRTDVVAVIGPSTSGESIEVAKLTEQTNAAVPPVVLSLAASREILGDPLKPQSGRRWVFKLAQNDDLAAARLVREMTRRVHSRVTLWYSQDGFGKSGAKAFEEVAQAPLRVVGAVGFDNEQPRAEALVGAMDKSVDAVVIWGTKPGPKLLVKELRRAQFAGQIYLSHGNASQEFLKELGSAGEGVIVVGSRVIAPAEVLTDETDPQRIVRDFQAFWRQNCAGEPSQFAGYARDAFELLRATLDENPTVSDRRGLRDAMESRSRPFVGVTGSYAFDAQDHAGLTEASFETFVVRQGKFAPALVGGE